MYGNPCLRAARKWKSGERVRPGVGVFRVEFGQRQTTDFLLEQSGATQNASRVRMLLKNMVGPWGLEPQTSTVSTTYKTAGTDIRPRGLPKYAEVRIRVTFCGLGCGLEMTFMLLRSRSTGLIVVATVTLGVKVTCGFSEDRRRTR